jgi:hypothetical protein
VRLELRFLHSPDLPHLEEGQVPPDPECFLILVQAFVAEVGEDTPTEGESFDFLVCTPRWLEAEVRKTGYLLGRHYIFVPRYDFAHIRRIIAALCEQAEGEDWQSVATSLGLYGQWEWDTTQPPKIAVAGD